MSERDTFEHKIGQQPERRKPAEVSEPEGEEMELSPDELVEVTAEKMETEAESVVEKSKEEIKRLDTESGLGEPELTEAKKETGVEEKTKSFGQRVGEVLMQAKEKIRSLFPAENKENKSEKPETEQIKELAAITNEFKNEDINFRQANPDLGEDQLEQHSRELLQKLFTVINEKDIWQYKFKSEYVAKDGTKNSQKDSVYYATRDGASLRFKMSLIREQGLEGVIHPFTEKILFMRNADDQRKFLLGHEVDADTVSEVPLEGYHTVEYITKEFLDFQDSEKNTNVKNIQLHNKIVRHDNKVRLQGLLPEDKVHFGHAIKNIESIKK